LGIIFEFESPPVNVACALLLLFVEEAEAVSEEAKHQHPNGCSTIECILCGHYECILRVYTMSVSFIRMHARCTPRFMVNA
jgi:hypothetical protein